MKKKRFLCTIATTAVIGVCLAGCSKPFELGSGQEDAVSLVKKYNSDAESNYNANYKIDMKMSAENQGMSIDIPIQLDMDLDVYESDAHGTGELDISVLGNSQKTNMEFYINGDYTWLKQDDGDWNITESKTAIEGMTALNPDLFENAKLEYDKKKDCYEVVLQLEDLLDDKEFAESFVNSMDFNSFNLGVDVDTDELVDSLKDSNITYTFNDKYQLTGIAIDKFSCKTTAEVEGNTIDVVVEMSINAELSKYGEIEKDDIEVPENMKNSASVKEDDNTVLMDEQNNLIPDDKSDMEEDSETEDTDMTESSDIFKEDSDTSDSKKDTVMSDDVYGSYKGVNISPYNMDWDSTFGSDGWKFDADDDGEYSFVMAKNPKYDEYLELYLYDGVQDNVFTSDIETKGFSGYKIDASLCDSQSYPDMTWNGVTFGATENEIKAAYGEPYNTYSDDDYTYLTYELSDDIELEFKTYEDKGLSYVQLSVY